MIRRGGSGASRIARHLWRICAALLIVMTSLFLGKQRLVPAAIVQTHLYLLPILAVIVLMIYWLCRLRFSNAYRKARKPAAPASTQWPKGNIPTRAL